MNIASNGPNSSSSGKISFWQGHIKAHQRSGLSIGRYCREQKIGRNAFDYWQRKLVSAPAPDLTEPLPVTIVPVPMHVLKSPEPSADLQHFSSLKLIVSDRFLIEIDGDFSAPVLEKLVTTLERLA